MLGLLSALVIPLALTPLPFTADGRNHILRTLLLERGLANGDWFARYFPELAYGYGAPLFSYYAPLTYYLTALIDGLGLGLSYAYQVALALALGLGGFGAAAWAGAWYGRRARLVAGVLWAAAPYVLYNVYTRGAGPEVLGLAWVPWLGWALSEAIQFGTLRSRLVLGAGAAALMLTHNLTALLGFGLLTIVGVAEIVVALRVGHGAGLVRRLIWIAVPLALGFAASSFFWVPALLETGYVQMSAATGPAGYDYRDNFLSLRLLLTGAFTYDPLRVLTPVPPTLGWGTLTLGGLGAASLIFPASKNDVSPATRAMPFRTLLVLVLALACTLMTLTISEPLWTALPMARLIQFPYRWLGPAALFFTLLGARGATWLQDLLFGWRRSRRLMQVMPLAIGATLIVLAWPWTFAKNDPTLLPSPDIEALYSAEAELGTIGLTSTGEFLPIGASPRPTPDVDWAHAVYAGAADRVDRAALDPTVSVTTLAQDRLTATVSIDSPTAVRLRFRWLYWPGWQATVDGAAVDTTAAAGSGFVEVPVPAGRHDVVVWLGLTPLRLAASVISDIAILVGVVLAAVARRKGRLPWRAPVFAEAHPWPAAYSMLMVGAVLVVARVGLAWTLNPFKDTRFDGTSVRGVEHPMRVVFGDDLVFLGLDEVGSLSPDTGGTLTSYWALARPVSRDLSFSFQLWDDTNHVVGQGDTQHPGGWPTRRWFAGEYAIDTMLIRPEATTPPGRYRLMVTVYAADGSQETLPGRIDNGPADAYVQVGEVVVTRGSAPTQPQDVLGATWVTFRDGPFSAVAAGGLPDRARSGDVVDVGFYWQARAPLGDVHPEVFLRDALGVQHDLGPARVATADFNESLWQPGDLWLIATQVVVPANAAPGRGAWVVRSDGESITLGAVTISVPERSTTAPAYLLGSRVRFGDVADLLGYRVTGDFVPGGSITVDLVWQSLQTTTQSLKVFVHVIGGDGFPAAQDDSVPQGGARPTTGWLPPEVVIDRHTVALPTGFAPGTYQLAVGLYDPATGVRVTVSPADTDPSGQPADHVALQTVEVLAR